MKLLPLVRRKSFIALFTVIAMLVGPVLLVSAQSAGAPTEPDRTSTDTPVTLERMIVPEVGTEATWIISEIGFMEMVNATGIFLLFPPEEFQESEIHTARARYTVLAADPRTKQPRIQVVAQPIDPGTGEPIGTTRWETVYLLTEDGAEWQSGSVIPGTYGGVVAPDWLADWLFTPFEELPHAEVEPGTSWHSAPELDLGEELFGMVTLPVTGEFVGWVQLPGLEAHSAHIAERFAGERALVPGQQIADDLLADIHYELSGGADYWLSPNEFPHQFEQHLAGDVVMVLPAELEEILGVTGTLALNFYFERTFQLDTLGADRLDSEEDTGLPSESIGVGQILTGTLGPRSLVLDDGTYADVYTFRGQVGDEVIIRLESNDFDAYLFLLDEQERLLHSDDDSAGGTNAQIRYELGYSGLHYVVVNAYFADEAGDYTFAVLSAEEPEGDLILVPGRPQHGHLHPSTSFQLDDGSYADFYTFFGVEGEDITVRLESEAFDAYLILFDELDTVIEDDDSGGGTDALLRYTLPYTGDYYVVVNSYFAGESGPYALVLEAARDVEASATEAIAMLERLQMGHAPLGDFERAEGVLAQLLQDIQHSLPFRLEPKHVEAVFDGQRYRMELTADAYLIADGTVVWEQTDVIHGVLESVHHNKELFLVMDLEIQDLPPGEYTWRMVVRDEVAGDSAAAEIPLVLEG